MKKIALFLMGLTVAAGALAAESLVAGHLAKGLKSGDSVQVKLLMLQKPKNSALIQITGIDSDQNNRIILHQMQKGDGRIIYIHETPAQNFMTLSETLSDGVKTYRLYFPGEKETMLLKYSEELSAQIKPADLLRDYENQERDRK
jgi:hypothetical protein